MKNKAKEFFDKHLNQDYICFVEEIDRMIIATCAVQIIEYLPLCTNLSGKVGYISNVYTKEAYRKRGIQKELMRECMEFIESQDISVSELSSSNPIARRLYHHFGFFENEYAMKLKIKRRCIK